MQETISPGATVYGANGEKVGTITRVGITVSRRNIRLLSICQSHRLERLRRLGRRVTVTAWEEDEPRIRRQARITRREQVSLCHPRRVQSPGWGSGAGPSRWFGRAERRIPRG